ncbi:MAG: papain-like cysteine protease family protein [Pseudomonadota bacterium]
MGVKLDVPMVTQQRNMSCWYASACMVAYYHIIGPREGLPEKWKQNNGITVPEFINLAKAEGLQSIKTPKDKLTDSQLEVFLRNYGPFWCAGYWDGVPHIVVLTGVEAGKVYINDPAPSKKQRVETIGWFNQKLAREYDNVMMYHKK